MSGGTSDEILTLYLGEVHRELAPFAEEIAEALASEKLVRVHCSMPQRKMLEVVHTVAFIDIA